ncbi:uncharacterized protein PV06_04107 [Exophiala oligosperma]|uniref:Uncharacterized protein n=1 Tax=Exophiala oligosperma TaxID=215243 RepID=A0A0D2B0U7_9EURO|nr:uncharacterized protein PV06_04107 [Exophiala oligosperma]KIW45746.1 hypothetical protein PV06_04107 [Exophiala oligosperma]
MRNFAYLDDNMIESEWDTCFNINAKSRLHLFHAVRSYLIATKGALVSVASLAGVIPSGSSIPYSVTKAAQIHLNKILAKISGPEIRVNSVCPGILLTVSTKHSSLCLEHALCGEGKLLCETPC